MKQRVGGMEGERNIWITQFPDCDPVASEPPPSVQPSLIYTSVRVRPESCRQPAQTAPEQRAAAVTICQRQCQVSEAAAAGFSPRQGNKISDNWSEKVVSVEGRGGGTALLLQELVSRDHSPTPPLLHLQSRCDLCEGWKAPAQQLESHLVTFVTPTFVSNNCTLSIFRRNGTAGAVAFFGHRTKRPYGEF